MNSIASTIATPRVGSADSLLIVSSASSTLARERAHRLLYFALGFTPIGCLSLAAFEVIPLHVSGPLLLLPAICIGALFALTSEGTRREVARGLALGLIAVTLYDCTRLPFVFAGTWADFIPKIGNYLLNSDDVHWSVGYAWRYLGNGGGMGLAFYMMLPFLPAKWDRRWVGLAYGVGVYLCLLGTVYLSPAGTTYLFDPTPFTATLGFIGHVVFGVVLGVGAHLLRRR